jgi:DNA repair protein RadD
MLHPYWFQQAAIDSIYKYYESNKGGNPLIALPTGTGKSVVIALFIESVLKQFPRQRIMMLTHVKELINQNAKRMIEAWPLAPLGIYSAGLRQRDIAQPIIFGGVKSVYKIIEQFGHRDILIIDEAHLLSPDNTSMYQAVINGLKEINPLLITIGLTATTYRMGQGSLTDNGIFTDIAFDMTNIEGFNRLVNEGFLAPIFPKKTQVEFDVSNVSMINGDYAKGELEKAVDKTEITDRILNELCYEGADRNHWLVFASGVEHAEHISESLNKKFGVSACAIHSKIPQAERDRRIEAFINGEVRCAVNNNVLTTGFDFPAIDLIGMLRPTISPGLWVQMCGRGTRVSLASGKRDCLVLDFAGNTRRLGPINDPVKPRKKGDGPAGDAPVRICSQCGMYNHASARQCVNCGHIFSITQKLVDTASNDELLRSDAPIIKTFKVQRVLYNRHLAKRPDAKPCLRVQYVCGLQSFSEWVHLDIPGAPGHRAREWWRMRIPIEPPTPANCSPFPTATDAALTVISTLREPQAIRVWVNRPHPEIQSVEF